MIDANASTGELGLSIDETIVPVEASVSVASLNGTTVNGHALPE